MFKSIPRLFDFFISVTGQESPERGPRSHEKRAAFGCTVDLMRDKRDKQGWRQASLTSDMVGPLLISIVAGWVSLFGSTHAFLSFGMDQYEMGKIFSILQRAMGSLGASVLDAFFRN